MVSLQQPTFENLVDETVDTVVRPLLISKLTVRRLHSLMLVCDRFSRERCCLRYKSKKSSLSFAHDEFHCFHLGGNKLGKRNNNFHRSLSSQSLLTVANE